jgi:hypothetical protein
VREIGEVGGAIYAPDAPADWTSPEGELQAGIVFAFAQYVRKRARAGFERAKARAIADGIPVATRPPAGYRKRADRRLEPDPAAAPTVSEVFRRRARGAGPVELADLLAANSVPTSQGSATWSKQAVYGLIANRAYLGELSYGKPPRYVNATAHEPIIDAATWQAAQKPNGTLAPPRSEASPFSLTGIVRCAACRYALQGTRTGRRKRIYRCTRRHSGGMCPDPVRVDADAIEDTITEAFWALYGELLMQASADTDTAGITDLEATAEASERAYVQWRDDPEAADEDYDEYRARLRSLRKRRDGDREAVGRAKASLPDVTNMPATADLRAAWATMTAQDRRGFLGDAIKCVAISRTGEMVVYPAGSAPSDLPRRGFTKAPVLRGFDAPPDGARVLAA